MAVDALATLSPGHQQPWYWLHAKWIFLSTLGLNFKNLSHFSVEKWYEMQIQFHFSEKNSASQGSQLVTYKLSALVRHQDVHLRRFGCNDFRLYGVFAQVNLAAVSLVDWDGGHFTIHLQNNHQEYYPEKCVKRKELFLVFSCFPNTVKMPLTHCGLVMLYGNLDPGQHWLR